MYSISEAAKQAIQNGNSSTITGTVVLAGGEEMAVSNDTIKQGSLYITKDISVNNDFSIGTASISELGVVIYNSTSKRNIFAGAQVKLFYCISVDEEGTQENIPLGVYNVYEPVRPAPDTIKLTCYDNMTKFDKKFELPDEWHMKMYELEPYNMLSHLCTLCGAGFGNTPKEIAAMPNGTKRIGFVYGAAFNSDIGTFRDVIADIAQLLGGFAYMDGEGKLRIRSFQDRSSVCTISDDCRKSTSISDYVKRISGVRLEISSVGSLSGSITVESPGISSDGSVISLRDSPFFRFRDKSVLEEYVSEIADVLTAISYVPGEADVFLPPCIEPGDMIRYTGKAAGDGTFSLITSADWIYRGAYRLVSAGTEMQVQQLVSAKTSADNQNEMLARVVAEANTKTFTHVPLIIYITPERCSIFKAEISVSSLTASPDISGQIVFEMKESGTVFAEYELDGKMLSEKVKQHCQKGMNTIDLFLPVVMDAGKHTVEVFVYCDKGYGISIGTGKGSAGTGQESAPNDIGIYSSLVSLESELSPVQINSMNIQSDACGEIEITE
ncbi:MAG: hypothetical protein ACI4I9_01740 [Porcipelethomonas sp.]